MSTLSQAIHGDVVDLGERTKRLQTHADRESRNTIPWNERREEKKTDSRTEELQYRLSRWLGVPDPSTNYHAALEKRHPETGLWLLNGQDFNNWKSSTSSLMWLHGNGTSRNAMYDRQV